MSEESRALRQQYGATAENVLLWTRILGGRWLERRSGKADDHAAAMPRGQVPREFCRLYGFPVKKSFAFAKYGVEAANTLAVEWARQGEFWCAHWVSEGGGNNYHFPVGMQNEEDLDFLGWLLLQDATSALWERGQEARQWRPKAPRR